MLHLAWVLNFHLRPLTKQLGGRRVLRPTESQITSTVFPNLILNGEQGYSTFKQELTSHLRDILLRPGETGYEDARQVYNAMINKQRALSARCLDFDEVILGVDPDSAKNKRMLQWARDYCMALHPCSAGGAMSTWR